MNAAPGEAKRFPRGCVVSPHYLASAAGHAVLAQGGNAVDAAVATNLVLGVVAPYACGYGGDLFAMVWDGDELHAYNGSGRAPAASTLERVAAVTGEASMPARGPHTVTIPGAVDGWFSLLARFGTKSFAELSSAALRYASDGFAPTLTAARSVASARHTFVDDFSAEWRAVYGGFEVGSRFRQPALAQLIALIGRGGPRAFYEGPVAEAIAAELASFGGGLTVDDLAAHEGEWVRTLSTSHRGVEMYQVPPNSQGVTALEAFNIADALDPHAASPDSPERHHLMIEAMKLALSDRDAYVTDPRFMSIDAAVLATPEWAAERASGFDPGRAGSPVPGRPAIAGTIHLCTADSDGMMVSLIQSNYAGFGSGVTVPEWGINLQNRGAHFSLDPSHANVIAGGKRTMHTLMPAMLFRDGQPWLAFGTEGGDGQAQTHLQVLSRIIAGVDLQQALDAPRWMVSPDDWAVNAESDLPSEILDGLAARGHSLRRSGPQTLSRAQVIERTPDGWAAATDRRAEGAAIGL